MKQVVLVCTGTYLPGYKAGGPIRSIENLVMRLGDEFEFNIVTSDRDLGDGAPFPGIAVNKWVRVGNANVMYLCPGVRGLFRICKLLSSLDRSAVLYLNGFFPRHFSILPALLNRLGLCRPHRVVLAPRGEFSSGALALKADKKSWYIRLSRWLWLYHSVVWQASSDIEAADILRQFPEATRVNIAGNLSGLPAGPGIHCHETSARSKAQGELRVLFVSRISRMKNLSEALRMLNGVSGDISFHIYGPAEDAAYWEECKALIATLPANIKVKYCGQIEHERLAKVFREHELLFLPTLGENFGHVICESLMSGCPVLISDRTPWRDLEAEGVGWAIPLGETKRFRDVLELCVEGDAEWHAAMSARASNYATRLTSDPKVVEASRQLFQHAFTGRDKAHPHPVQA